MSDAPDRPTASAPPDPGAVGDTAAPGPEDTGNRPAAAPASAEQITAAGPGAAGLFGNFTVLEKLGEGGMGAVYLAEEVKLKRKVAIKTMRPEIAAQPEAV